MILVADSLLQSAGNICLSSGQSLFPNFVAELLEKFVIEIGLESMDFLGFCFSTKLF